MSDESNTRENISFFKRKHFITVFIIAIAVVGLISFLSIMNVDVDKRGKVISDNLFAIAIMFFIFAVFAQSRSWSLFKKGIKKHEDSFLDKAKKTKIFAKSFAVIGVINLLVSIITLLIFY